MKKKKKKTPLKKTEFGHNRRKKKCRLFVSRRREECRFGCVFSFSSKQASPTQLGRMALAARREQTRAALSAEPCGRPAARWRRRATARRGLPPAQRLPSRRRRGRAREEPRRLAKPRRADLEFRWRLRMVEAVSGEDDGECSGKARTARVVGTVKSPNRT